MARTKTPGVVWCGVVWCFTLSIQAQACCRSEGRNMHAVQRLQKGSVPYEQPRTLTGALTTVRKPLAAASRLPGSHGNRIVRLAADNMPQCRGQICAACRTVRNKPLPSLYRSWSAWHAP